MDVLQVWPERLVGRNDREARNPTGNLQWRQTAPELILCTVRWYLRYSLSLRDVEELLAEPACFDHRDRTRSEPSSGCGLSHRKRRRERQTVRRRHEKICYALRQRTDAASKRVLVVDYVRREVFLRAELPEPLYGQFAQQVPYQS